MTTRRRRWTVRADRALPWLAALLAGGAIAQGQIGPSGPAFPVPRAEQEFTALMPDLQAYTEHKQGDVKAFINSATLYGPLDLQVRKAQTPEEASHLRGFHLGIAAAASGMPEALMMHLGTPFLHTPADVRVRKQRLLRELPQISAFVTHLRATPQVRLLAQWGFQGECRVNNAVVSGEHVKDAVPSPIMGFVPSGQWAQYPSLAQYLATLPLSPAAFQGLYAQFQPLLLVAADRTEGGGTEVVGLGMGNNTSGLLFSGGGAGRPQLGQRLADGRRYSDVEPVRPGVFYFETD